MLMCRAGYQCGELKRCEGGGHRAGRGQDHRPRSQGWRHPRQDILSQGAGGGGAPYRLTNSVAVPNDFCSDPDPKKWFVFNSKSFFLKLFIQNCYNFEIFFNSDCFDLFTILVFHSEFFGYRIFKKCKFSNKYLDSDDLIVSGSGKKFRVRPDPDPQQRLPVRWF